jgi:hypothetical protein
MGSVTQEAQAAKDPPSVADRCDALARDARAHSVDVGLSEVHGRWFQSLAVLLEQEGQRLREPPATRVVPLLSLVP